MEKDEKRVISIALISILILTALYIHSQFLEPEKVEISSIKNHVGEYVEVEGIVRYCKNTTKGTMVELYDMERENNVYLFLLFHKALSPGYVIRAEGIVQVYQGMVEIIVKEEGDVQIMNRSLDIGLEELMFNPQFFVGMKVRVYGNLTHIYPVVDEHQIKITDGINTTWVYVPFSYFGERDVYLIGIVENATLHVENITLRYEGKCISVGEIADYEGKRICVHAKILEYERIYGYVGWLKNRDYSLKIFMKEKREEGFQYIQGTFLYDSRNGMYELVVE